MKSLVFLAAEGEVKNPLDFHLVEALQGAGNQPGDTTVRVSNLMNHLGKTVPETARSLCQAEQTPYFDTAAEDFANSPGFADKVFFTQQQAANRAAQAFAEAN